MASSREVSPVIPLGCAWEEAKRGTPSWSAGWVSFTRCQPTLPKGSTGGVCTLWDQRKTTPHQAGPSQGWDPRSGEHQAPKRSCSLIPSHYQGPRSQGHHCPSESILQEGLSYSVITWSGGKTPQEQVHMTDFVNFAKHFVIAIKFHMGGIQM